MKKNKKVVRYRKPFNINIGIIIFIIIFIYLVFNVYTYLTTVHIPIYEVEQGTMAENNVYRGLVLREEEVVQAPFSGAVNYYVREVSRIGYGTLVYSVDENGDVSKKLNEANKDMANLNKESLSNIEERIAQFENTYDPMSYYHVYPFRDDISSTLSEALNLGALQEFSDYAANAQNNHTFHPVYTDKPGIVTYYTDGFEHVTADNFTAAMFDEASYQRENLAPNLTVEAGDAVYKRIDSEQWQIIIPVQKTLAKKLAESDTIKIRFVKDGKTAYATYEIQKKKKQNYLILTLRNAMIRYAKDRFLEVELLLNEETGLKIPNSAITEKEFFAVPIVFFTKGGDSDTEGLLVERTDNKGKRQTEYLSPTIYYKTEEYYYIDSEVVSAKDQVIRPNSTDTYTIGTDTASLKGVYNVNKGYAVFKQIDILYHNEEYTIVKTGTPYGISLYDHIALDSSKVSEDELLK